MKITLRLEEAFVRDLLALFSATAEVCREMGVDDAVWAHYRKEMQLALLQSVEAEIRALRDAETLPSLLRKQAD